MAPGLVLTVSSNNIEDNVATVTDALRSPRARPDDLSLFDALIDCFGQEWPNTGLERGVALAGS